ncbi:MAG: Nicotinate-nucleotide adenylyltransferase [Myxococcota bacterium]|nr:Nicotinate-nucleotide adenylyltransferase [Myxococcota bacterium]
MVFYLLHVAGYREVWVIPAWRHAFGKSMLDYEERAGLLELALSPLIPLGARISRIEQELGGVSWTVDTLRALCGRHPGQEFHWIAGADYLTDRRRWKEPEVVESLAKVVVLSRGGIGAGSQETVIFPEISSQDIRERIRSGGEFSTLVPRMVAERIRERGLYQSSGENG